MAYTNLNFVPGEILTAAKMNLLSANDASFNDGTGLGDSTIQPQKLNQALTEGPEWVPCGYGGSFRAMRYGNIVTAQLGSIFNNHAGNRTETIPEEYRPLEDQHIVTVAINSGYTVGYGIFHLKANGAISYFGATGHNEWYFNATYFAQT